MTLDSHSGSVQHTTCSIVYADIFAYTSLMEHSELETHIKSKDAIKIAKTLAKRHAGLVAQDSIGDGIILLFEEASEAVCCALGIQQHLRKSPIKLNNGELVLFRIAIHHGDVLVDQKKYAGNTINQAARMQSVAEPGGLLLSNAVFVQLPESISCSFTEFDIPELKNLRSLSRLYALSDSQHVDHFDADVTKSSNFAQNYRPCIAVAPPLSNRAEESTDSSIIAELLTGCLSQFNDFTVTAPTQNAPYSRNRAAFLRLCRMEGVEYVLESTLVTTSANYMVLSCRVFNASENQIIWKKDFAGKNDTENHSLLALAEQATVAVWATVRTYETRTNRTALSNNIVSYTFNSARALVRSSEHMDIIEGLIRLEKIVAEKPDFHLAKIELAYAYQIAWRFDIHINKRYTLDMAIKLMESVIAEDPLNGEAHRELGYALLFGRENLTGIEAMEKSVDLNPLDVMSISNLAEGYTFTNQGTRALEFSKRSLSMESTISKDWRLWGYADAHYCMRDYQGVIDTVNQMDDQSEGLRLKAASLANLDKTVEAKNIKDIILKKTPEFKVSKWRSKPPYTDVSETDHLCYGLLKAGLPN